MAAHASTAVYTVDSCSFTCGGSSYDVASVDMTARINEIPVCTVGIAPAGGSGKASVHTLDLGSLKDVLDDLSAKAVRMTYASLRAFLSGGGPAGSAPEQLVLDNWILVGVGLSRVSTTSMFKLECIIAHPAYALKTCPGFFYDGTNAVRTDQVIDGVTDIVSAAHVAVNLLKTVNKDGVDIVCDPVPGMSTPLKSASEVAEDMASALDRLDGYLGYLKWDPGFSNASSGIPCEDALLDGRMILGMKHAMVAAWIGGGSGKSVWDGLMGMSQEFGISVVPTYAEKTLSVVPTNPWMKPDIVIPDHYVSEFDAPGLDPDPVYGMTTRAEESFVPPPGTTTFSMDELSGMAAPGPPSVLAFVPSASVVGIGGIKVVGRPQWYVDASAFAADMASMEGLDDVADGSVTFDQAMASDPAGSSQDNPDLKTWHNAVTTYLANRFMTSYREGVSASMLCPFLPNWGGSPVIPGKTAVFTSGEPLFQGMVSVVHHHIDCASSTASTTLVLSHCVTDSSIAGALGSQPSCPMYRTAYA